MILGWDVLSELQIYLCFSGYDIWGNGGVCEGCTTLMKDVNKVCVITPTEQLDDEMFRHG